MKTALNILRLLDMLSGIRSYSKNEIMEKLELSGRNFFRYIAFYFTNILIINNIT